MTIDEFVEKHNACQVGVDWAKKHCKTGLMSEAYEKLKKGRSKDVQEFFEWVFYRAHPKNLVHKVACRFVRETTLADGRKVWDLLTDDRSRIAIEVAELFADGMATKEELDAARAAAWAALDAALDAAWAAGAAVDAASAEQTAILREYPNPFTVEGE